MGPSGSGKSTLMHILAGLDKPTAGTVLLDGQEITGLDDGELTKLRRDKLGFVFQFFNLLPVLTAEENLVLPLSIAGRKPDDASGSTSWSTPSASGTAAPTGPRSSPAASSSASRSPGPWSPNRPSSSPTSRPATSTRRPSADVLRLLRQAVDEFGQTVIMVTHDPAAAAHADRLITLRDGRIVHDDASRLGRRRDRADEAG